MLTPGTYRLTVDVVNPHPDRRTRDDWTKVPVWGKGTLLIVLERGRDEKRDTFISLVGDRFAILHRFNPWDDQYGLLAPHMEPCEETLEGLFTRIDVDRGSQYFIRFMVESGHWCHAQVEMLWRAYEQHDDPDETNSSTSQEETQNV